jgi:uncharacterized membrane protein YeiH
MNFDPSWLTNYGLLIFEVLGVLAFALSGALEAARKKFDAVGVVFVAFVAAFGGGTLRDVLIDRRPFFWIEQEFWIWIIIAAAIALPFVLKANHVEPTQRAMQIPDAIGLGVFAATGTQIALNAQFTPLIAVCMGVITAVVGGLLRDVLVNEVPAVLNDHRPYATLAFAGSWIVVLFQVLKFDQNVGIFLAAIAIIGLRIAGLKFRWKLPRWNLKK